MPDKPINIELINTLLQKSAETSEDVWQWRYKVHSSLLVVATTLFAVVVSLPNSSSDNCRIPWWVYPAVVSLNALCVLSLAGLLYTHIRMCNLYLRRLGKHIRDAGANLNRVSNGFYDDKVPMPSLYAWLSRISYISFGVMVIAYMVLGWLRA